MTITLLAQRLSFVSLGTGKIHAQNKRFHGAFTMCGRAVTVGSLTIRTLRSERLCGRCVATLKTYTGRMGMPVEVIVESDEVKG